MTAASPKTPAACRIPICSDHAVAVRHHAGDAGRETVFLIERDFQPIGMVGIDWREPDAPELGYWLGVDHWGQGFATEAVRAAIDYAFEEFDIEHLFAGARVANPASRNVLEKCGFQWSGVELHRFEALGSSTPVDCFKLTARGVGVAEELAQFDAAGEVAPRRVVMAGLRSRPSTSCADASRRRGWPE